MPRQTANSQRAGLPSTPNPDPNSAPNPEPPMAHIQEISTLGNNPHPDPTPETTPIPPVTADQHTETSVEPPVPDIASALLKLADSLSGPKTSGSWTKVCEPDTFNGTDARKLQSFIVQCTLNFRITLDWFEPGLTSMDPPDWLDDYSNFLSELKTNFGPHNPEAEAEAKLENLRMRDNQRINKYTVEFNRLSVRVRWGEAALLRQYYNGLPAWIKDAFMITGRPDTLVQLKNHSHTIDNWYWERRSEQIREARTQDRSSDKGKSSNSGNNSGNTNSGNNNSSNNKSDKKRSSNNSGRSGTPGSSGNSGSLNNNYRSTNKTPDLSTKLGKDGKLTQQERQRRFEQNLCMFCGKGGHVAKDCHKAIAAKACSATTDTKSADKTSDAKSSESKNQ